MEKIRFLFTSFLHVATIVVEVALPLRKSHLNITVLRSHSVCFRCSVVANRRLYFDNNADNDNSKNN